MAESIGSKPCSKCGVPKPLTPEFWHRNKNHASGFHYWCKDCVLLPRRTGITPGKARPPANEGMRLCPQCEVEKPLTTEFWFRNKSLSHGFQGWCKCCNNKASNGKKLDDRIMVLTHYSGGIPCCSCCGESEIIVLSLDHINGGGNKHRKELTAGIYRWIIVNSFPEGFRVLCRNCDWYCRMNHGHCYH